MRLHKLGFSTIITTVLLASTLATATTLERMSIAKMSQTAQLIVRARCLTNSVAWDAGEIWTFTTFAVEDSWKSAPPGAPAQLTVRLLGGSVGNLTSTVSGVPHFQSGEEVMLFLQPAARGDFSIVGWIQGTFRIRRDLHTGDQIVIQDSATFETFNPATRQFNAVGIRKSSLAAFQAQVRSALGARTGEEK